MNQSGSSITKVTSTSNIFEPDEQRTLRIERTALHSNPPAVRFQSAAPRAALRKE